MKPTTNSPNAATCPKYGGKVCRPEAGALCECYPGKKPSAAWRRRFEVGVLLLALAASVLSVLRGDAFAAATSACLFGVLSAQTATRMESPMKKLALALLHARDENLYPRLPRFVRRWVYTRTAA